MQNTIKSITVYASSSDMISRSYHEVAQKLGKIIAGKQIKLVYGGGPFGLMGTLADAVLDAGGAVCGVIPKFMVDRGWLHKRLSELIITKNMHQRKQIMAERSEACIALPGGVGTLEELFEILAWRQLGLYVNPVVILNIDGFYDNLIEMLDKIERERFMRHHSGELFSIAATPEEALEIIEEQKKIPAKPLE